MPPPAPEKPAHLLHAADQGTAGSWTSPRSDFSSAGTSGRTDAAARVLAGQEACDDNQVFRTSAQRSPPVHERHVGREKTEERRLFHPLCPKNLGNFQIVRASTTSSGFTLVSGAQGWPCVHAQCSRFTRLSLLPRIELHDRCARRWLVRARCGPPWVSCTRWSTVLAMR
jgi:hypothetical protein